MIHMTQHPFRTIRIKVYLIRYEHFQTLENWEFAVEIRTHDRKLCQHFGPSQRPIWRKWSEFKCEKVKLYLVYHEVVVSVVFQDAFDLKFPPCWLIPGMICELNSLTESLWANFSFFKCKCRELSVNQEWCGCEFQIKNYLQGKSKWITEGAGIQ